MIARTYAAEGGTTGTPAFTYVDEPGLGLYRAGAGKQAHQGDLWIQGAAEITGTLTVAGTLTANGGVFAGVTNPIAGVVGGYKRAGDVSPIDATTPWSAIDWIAVGT